MKRPILEMTLREYDLTHRGDVTDLQKTLQESAAQTLSDRLHKTSMTSVVVTTVGNHGYDSAIWETQEQYRG